jgi:hypothetical protein
VELHDRSNATVTQQLFVNGPLVSEGAKIAHSSSVISPRITVGLEVAKRPVKIDRKSVN